MSPADVDVDSGRAWLALAQPKRAEQALTHGIARLAPLSIPTPAAASNSSSTRYDASPGTAHAIQRCRRSTTLPRPPVGQARTGYCRTPSPRPPHAVERAGARLTARRGSRTLPAAPVRPCWGVLPLIRADHDLLHNSPPSPQPPNRTPTHGQPATHERRPPEPNGPQGRAAEPTTHTSHASRMLFRHGLNHPRRRAAGAALRPQKQTAPHAKPPQPPTCPTHDHKVVIEGTRITAGQSTCYVSLRDIQMSQRDAPFPQRGKPPTQAQTEPSR